MINPSSTIKSFYFKIQLLALGRKQFVILIITLLATVVFYQSQTKSLASIDIKSPENEIFNLTNQSRIKEGLTPLKWNDQLYEAAQDKLKDMETDQYFDHVSPIGTTPWVFIKQNDYIYDSAGENLAMDFKDPALVVKAWLESPTHKANILDLEFKEIGIAYNEINFEDQPTIFIVQMFGNPASKFNVLGEKLLEGTGRLAP